MLNRRQKPVNFGRAGMKGFKGLGANTSTISRILVGTLIVSVILLLISNPWLMQSAHERVF